MRSLKVHIKKEGDPLYFKMLKIDFKNKVWGSFYYE